MNLSSLTVEHAPKHGNPPHRYCLLQKPRQQWGEAGNPQHSSNNQSATSIRSNVHRLQGESVKINIFKYS